MKEARASGAAVRWHRNRIPWLVPAVAVIGLSLLSALVVGETRIPAMTVFHTLANEIWQAGYTVDPIDRGILWNYRLPRAIVAASCGAALAVSGAVLQALLRNSLADPYILGLSAGASTGAVLTAIVGLGAGAISLSGGAFIGAVTAFAVVALLARLSSGESGSHGVTHVILAGIAGSQLFHALTSFIIAKSASAEQARGIMFWLLGNLSGIRWPDVSMAVPAAVVGIIIILLHARALDAFSFGSDAAASLGISVRRVQIVLIGATAMLTAVMVSLVGSIGFVGLVIPHAARFLVGPRHAKLLPICAIIGASFLILADIASRIVVPSQVLPIGVVTALVGAPAFAVILVRGRRR